MRWETPALRPGRQPRRSPTTRATPSSTAMRQLSMPRPVPRMAGQPQPAGQTARNRCRCCDPVSIRFVVAMPNAAPRVCSRCHQLAPAGQPCPCRAPWEGSPQRGARGRRWARFRLFRLRADPICQWINNDGTGCRLLASVVDHVVPLAEGGAEYDWDNTQCLCRSHHQQKTTADAQRGKRRARGHA
jgi:5-methylcytosine-specific restriction protein A